MTSNSKLSVQAPDLFKYTEAGGVISDMQPIAVKVLLGGEQLSNSIMATLYDDCPNTWIIVRITQIESGFNADNLAIEGPENMAQRWVSVAMSYAGYFKDKKRTLLEGPFNEFSSWVLAAEFTRFEDKRQKLLAELGYGAMLCNFAVGTPEADFWPKFAPALRTAKLLGNAVGLHLYCPLYAQDDYQWFAGRFGFLTDFYAANPDCRVPIFATEGGIDDCLANNAARRQQISCGYHTSGWQNCEAAFRCRQETGELADIFYREMVVLDDLLKAVPEFVCYCIFTYERPDAGWGAFDVKKDDVIGRLVDRVNPRVDGQRKKRSSLVNIRLDGSTTPPPVVDPPPVVPPVTEPGPNLLRNASFEDGSRKTDPNGDWDIPNEWDILLEPLEIGTVHVEVEHHPPHVVDGVASARVWQSGYTRLAGLAQAVPVELGATYELEASALSWATNDAQVGTPSQSDIDVRFGIESGAVTVYSPWFNPRDAYMSAKVQATVTDLLTLVLLEARPKQAMARTDVFFDKVSFRKIASAPPVVVPPPPVTHIPPFRGRVKIGVRLNFRQDASAETSANIWQVLNGGTEFDIWQSEAYVQSVQAAKAGWICVKIGDRIGFLAFSYCELL